MNNEQNKTFLWNEKLRKMRDLINNIDNENISDYELWESWLNIWGIKYNKSKYVYRSGEKELCPHSIRDNYWSAAIIFDENDNFIEMTGEG